jgi:hypothetical protein
MEFGLDKCADILLKKEKLVHWQSVLFDIEQSVTTA